ncbi:insulin-like growth factor-binding protein 1a precursor [Salmo salar]|uniref:Insulin-like growth factor-binding protein 1 n=1 Tax=Salmo salar TaxID=8030 RepID=M4QG84_SALSA|eukprot:NP_001266069.1 insulin-like growth factor binding protein 1 paralog A1 precursor [Salmo salar]
MSGLFHRNVLVAAAVCCSVLVRSVLGSPVLAQEPIRCAPCSPEKLSECPAVAPGCAEVLREPGCGCCLACALKTGDLCGIYTAPCGSGLRCTPRPGDLRPLHSLTRGQAVCTEIPEPERSPVPQNPDQGAADYAETENAAMVSDPGSSLYLHGHSKPFDPRAAADALESMKAKVNAIRKKLVEQGPCHVELQRALEKIAKSQQKLGDKLIRFYLPNCDKHGLYKAKQCESSLDGQKGRCWCVSFWNGKKILGSTDLEGDAECAYEINH